MLSELNRNEGILIIGFSHCVKTGQLKVNDEYKSLEIDLAGLVEDFHTVECVEKRFSIHWAYFKTCLREHRCIVTVFPSL